MNEREFREQLIREMMKQRGFDFDFDPLIQAGHFDPLKRAGKNGQPVVNPETGEVEETWQQHSRRLLKDWEPHYNEKSGQRVFVDLINLVCANLRKRGLYVHVKEHNDTRAVLRVSYDRPGAKEQTFVLKNEDGINYSWRIAMTNWRDL